jgi:hypothetical protein
MPGRVLRTVFMALALSACGEKPQQVLPPAQDKISLPAGAGDPLHERALSQGESGRIYH